MLSTSMGQYEFPQIYSLINILALPDSLGLLHPPFHSKAQNWTFFDMRSEFSISVREREREREREEIRDSELLGM